MKTSVAKLLKNKPFFSQGVLWFLFLTFTLTPLFLGLGYAFLYSLGWVGVLAKGFTLEYWRAVLSQSEFWQSLGLTMYLSLLSLIPPVILALYLATRFQGILQKGSLNYFIYFPLAIPAIVVAFFTMQMLAKSGFVSRLVLAVGFIEQLEQFPDLVNDFGGWGIIFAHWLMATPFLTVMFLGMHDSEQLEELKQVAITLGANVRQAYWRVSIPVLLKKAYPTIILYGIFLFGAYEIPLLLGRQSPQMISVLITRKVNRYDLTTIPEGYAMAVIYTLFMLMMVSLLLRKEGR